MFTHKTWLITQREFFYNLLRPTYLLTAFVIPLIIAVVSYVAIEVIIRTELSIDKFNQVGYVDQTGLLTQPEGEDYKRYLPYRDEETALADLQANVLQAYLLIPPDYMTTGEIKFVSSEGLPQEFQAQVGEFLVAGLAAGFPDQPALQRAAQPLEAEIRMLGEDESFSTTALLVRFGAPLVFGFLLLFNVTTSSQFLMSGVVEEKENFIMEVLATSVRPIELITGKVIGLGGLALLQMGFWLILGLIIGLATGRLEVLSEARFEPLTLAVSLIYFLLFFLMFSGIMIGIGAAASADQEARQIASIFMLVAILPPTWGMALILDSPESPFTLFLSLFPFTSPLTMMILIGINKAAVWQVLLSLLILVVTIAVILWASARIFRAGMLNAGQRLSLKQIRNVLRG